MKVVLAVAVAAAALGDAAIAALITVAGTLLNTALLIRVERRQRETHRAIAAPRRLRYDAEGRPIGTVLKLDDDCIEQTHRRHSDPPPPEV